LQRNIRDVSLFGKISLGGLDFTFVSFVTFCSKSVHSHPYDLRLPVALLPAVEPFWLRLRGAVSWRLGVKFG
jgi:hypothetical protein